MNGAHDMGGVMGFGPVVPEPNEPVFHGRWEERVMAMTIAMAFTGGWNLDQSRSARENRAPLDYLSRSYYEIWFAGLTRLAVERGLISTDELATGTVSTPRGPAKPAVGADDIRNLIAAVRPYERAMTTPARYRVGDRVRAKNMHPTGHTRLPRYVRGHVGVVTLVHGGHVFPDRNVAGDEAPEWLYTVRFTGTELWGADADPTVSVSVDAWESYLEPVT
jgi:nitrile hydratase